MHIKLKKNWLIISFSIVLFSLISISIAQAGIFKVNVYHAEYCPRQGAYVRIYNTSYPPTPPYNPLGFCFVTNEEGYCQTTAPMAPDWLYKANATWPDGTTLYGEAYFTTDGNGDIKGIATIRNSSYPYPNGTEACGDSECDGYQFCYGDASKYIKCNSTDTECDTKDCCQCDSGTQANPAQNYDETQDEDCDSYDLPAIGQCDWIPDEYYPTWDYHAAIDSVCQDLNTCTYESGYYAYTHTCNDDNLSDTVTDGDCGATCDEDVDCSDECSGNKSYSTYSCNPGTCNCDLSDLICSVGHCGAECDEDPDCVNYCVGETRYYNGDCDLASTCTCSFSTENCNSYDGCYPYEDGCEQKNYYCNLGNCLYSWENRNTDSYDSPELYCSAETIRNRTKFHDWYCNGYCTDHESWVNDHLEEDCDAYDNYYDTGNTRWVSTGECTEKEEKEQIWEEWICNQTLPVHCSYYNTTTRWIDTGNTSNKDDGTPCDDELWCTVNDQCTSGVCGGLTRDCSDGKECTYDICNESSDQCENPNKTQGTECGLARDCPFDQCVGFFAYFYPLDGHDTCDGSGNCMEYSCALEDSYCTDDNSTDGINGLTCGAPCDYNDDCEGAKACLGDCTCSQIEGDLNGDCIVNIFDLVRVGRAYDTHPGDDYWNPLADVVVDDWINIQDLSAIGSHFGETC